MKQKALITGITGQDGSYLAELLLEKGYEVIGIVRRSSSFNRGRIDHLHKNPHNSERQFKLVYGDLADMGALHRIVREEQPSEIYNLGAQSHVRVSFDIPEHTTDIIVRGTLGLLEAIKDFSPSTRFYQASSSEMFGKVKETPQTENTPFNPRSPYACAKVYAHWITSVYRDSYDIFACSGILFNHESPRRGETFVTKKITRGLVDIKNGKQDCLYLGNLNAKRDWGYAKDYVEAMWRMLQQDTPDDYVIATGETHSVREFIEESCKVLEIDLEWQGEGLGEKGIDRKTGKTLIEIDERYFRPAEVDLLFGDPSRAADKLGWRPSTKFSDLVRLMVESDLNEA